MFGLIVTALLLIWSGAGLSQSSEISRFVWQSDDPAIGGMSAIEVADDGLSLVALSDRGFFAAGQILRDENGQIINVTAVQVAPLRVSGAVMPGASGKDSEGIAVAQDGTIYVSFEGAHRVAAFETITSEEVTLPPHPDFAGFQNNSSLEALAIDANGDLYTMPERSGRYDTPFPIYRYRDGAWDIPYALPRVGSFLAVGADFGPDGMLYVLERDFTGFSFLNRVRRIDLDAGTSNTVIMGGGQFGNLEGISVWRNAVGELIVTMIADNNNSFLLPTEIVEFRIDG